MPSLNQLEQWLTVPSVRAFLDTIARSEGANYNTLVGGGTFSSYARHPRIYIAKYNSTAAGRYQFIKGTWDSVQQELGLKDFTPHSQDLGAVELIRRRGAMPALLKGDVQTAMFLCRKEWASLPGANYPGQRMQKAEFLLKYYASALAAYGGQAVSTVTTAAVRNPKASGGLVIVVCVALLALLKR